MPDPDLEIRGGREGIRSSRPLDKGRGGLVSQKIFLDPQFGLKIRGGGEPSPPELLPWIRLWWHIISIEFKNIYGDQSGESSPKNPQEE